jgi:hypothetical protein
VQRAVQGWSLEALVKGEVVSHHNNMLKKIAMMDLPLLHLSSAVAVWVLRNLPLACYIGAMWKPLNKSHVLDLNLGAFVLCRSSAPWAREALVWWWGQSTAWTGGYMLSRRSG